MGHDGGGRLGIFKIFGLRSSLLMHDAIEKKKSAEKRPRDVRVFHLPPDHSMLDLATFLEKIEKIVN